MIATTEVTLPSSFRDPSGFLFHQDGGLYRQVNQVYREHYDHLIQSGLYHELVQEKLLIPHQEQFSVAGVTSSPDHYKTLCPEPIPFISYPYEWCFSQLKEAALITLEIQKTALKFGMTLKDASAYNIQFTRGRAIFIDTLSFEIYQEGQPWIAYRQFCQHFLAPLALMANIDLRLNQLLRIHLDGIPLDLTSSLLPWKTHFQFSLLSHIHLHAKSQKKYENASSTPQKYTRLRKTAFLGLIDSLETAVSGLRPSISESTWSSYYDETNYSDKSMQQKIALVGGMLDITAPRSVWDLGSNTGLFSRLAAQRGSYTVSFEADPLCVEANYRTCKEKDETNVIPLVLDLTNPSSNIGWANQERLSLQDRGPTDMLLVLALIHHLAIANNVPLARIAGFLQPLCKQLVIEFVPKSDSQVKRLLSTRKDIFPQYTQTVFEEDFGKYFSFERAVKIQNTERTLYLLKSRS